MDREQVKHYLRYLLILPLGFAIYISINMGGFLGWSLASVLTVYAVLVLINLWTNQLDTTIEWFQILVILGFFVYALVKKNWLISIIFLGVAVRAIYVNLKDRILIVHD